MDNTNNKTTVAYFINDFDIEMLSIKPIKGNTVHISLRKAIAILDTNEDASLIEPIKKHGRNMYKISHVNPSDRPFVVGLTKIDIVLNNSQGILLALHASIDARNEA